VRVIVGRSWRCCSASRARTRSPLARSRPRGPPNRWSATRTLAPGTCHETINSPLLAANLAAAFVTAWSDNDGVANAPDSLHATIGTAGGALTLPRTIASAAEQAQDAVVGIDGHGNAVLLWDSWRAGWTHGMFAALHRE
jgi:hypothetical protein